MGLAEYEKLVDMAVVLAEDSHGPKVFQARDGRIVKLFRRKRIFSSALISPYARRFEQNAKRLYETGFHTVHVTGVYRIPGLRRDCVIYPRIPGRIIRELAKGDGVSRDAMGHALGKVGALLAELHGQGFLFRSVHLGNIVSMPDGELALIDVSDLRRWPWGGLPYGWRVRNFGHIWRYPEDRTIIRLWGVAKFVNAYLDRAALDGDERRRLGARLEKYLRTSS